MRKYLLIIVFLGIIAGNINGRTDGRPAVRIHQSPAIASLVEKHKAINKQHPKSDGYRVQIFSISGANSSDRANLMKAEFLDKYPDSKVYIIYHAPSYKVRIGNFRTKLEALNYIRTIQKDYPFAFVVVDKIEFE